MRASQTYLLISSIFMMGAVLTVPMMFPAGFAPTRAQAQVAQDRMPQMPGKPGPELPQSGNYLAGDTIRFRLDKYREYERLRFAGNDEIYYLSIEPAALGGRVLKYDTGDVALQVAGWGGVTIYTVEHPGGVPAERLGDAAPLADFAAAPDAKTLAQRLSEEIQSRTGLTIGFRANWEALNQSDLTRALATDAIRNATLSIERVATTRRIGQQLFTQFSIVRIATANDPGVAIGDRLLTIQIATSRGFAGRPSTVAITKAIRDRL